MGACSTKTISRQTAIADLVTTISVMSDEQLESVMEHVFGGEHPLIQGGKYLLSHFSVGPEDEEDEDFDMDEEDEEDDDFDDEEDEEDE